MPRFLSEQLTSTEVGHRVTLAHVTGSTGMLQHRHGEFAIN